MRNATICNLFVTEHNLEYVTHLLSDMSVVVKKISAIDRVQVTVDYVGVREDYYELNFFDALEQDVFYVRVPEAAVIRSTIFSKEIAPDDFMN